MKAPANMARVVSPGEAHGAVRAILEREQGGVCGCGAPARHVADREGIVELLCPNCLRARARRIGPRWRPPTMPVDCPSYRPDQDHVRDGDRRPDRRPRLDHAHVSLSARAAVVRESGGKCACGRAARRVVVRHGGSVLEIACSLCRMRRAWDDAEHRRQVDTAAKRCRGFRSRFAEPRGRA